MRILVICQYYYPEQFRINDICETLAKKGNDVTVVTGLPNYPSGYVPKEYKFFKKRKENIKHVNVIRCFEIGRRKTKKWRILNYLSFMISASFKMLFLKQKFDVVYVYQLSPITMALPAVIYKKIHKNKNIYLYCLDLWPESLLVEGFSQDNYIYKILYKFSRWVYNKCDVIIVTSKGFIEYFKNNLKINKKIIYLPQYCEENIYQNKKIDFTPFQKDKTNFVYAGNIGKAQSVETIIRAAKLLDDNNIFIHIVGDGSSIENCKKLANELEIKNVYFYGRKSIEKIFEFYDMADAMLITLAKNATISRTIPGKLQSYMASGKPIIGAIDGAAKQIILEAHCGYCVNSEDYIGLSKIMKKIADENAEIKILMSKNSYRYYKENFEKSKFIKKLLSILKEEENNV